MNRKKYRRCLVFVFIVYLFVFLYFSLSMKTEDVSQTAVAANPEIKLMPLGMPVGIYIRTKGIMVLGTGAVTTCEGDQVEPAADVLESGDYILALEDKTIETIEDLTDVLETWDGGDMLLTVLRNDEETKVRLTPVRSNDGSYKIGVWVRQDAQGIGTLTYVDSENHFAALGHSITDVDTSRTIDISGGRLYPSNIFSIVKGQNGVPGEMVGNIDYRYSQVMGTIESNNENGIYGTFGENIELYDESQAIPVGYSNEIKKGAAVIRCYIDGEVKDYAVEIESIRRSGDEKNRDMVIKITDEELLKETNGIIQGMSGSPIIQDGKLIGAVTHVFVNDCTKGYGIFVEKMLVENN
jgi:stage IV sporulation protein B